MSDLSVCMQGQTEPTKVSTHDQMAASRISSNAPNYVSRPLQLGKHCH